MSTVKVTIKQTMLGRDLNTVLHYNNLSSVINSTGVGVILTHVESVIIPALNAVQSDDVLNVGLDGFAYNLGYSIPEGLTGSGDLALTPDEVMPPQYAMLVRKDVGETYLTDGAVLYTGNRPIRRGEMFLSGLPESFSGVNGVIIPAALATEWDTLLDALIAPVAAVGATPIQYPVVFGLPLAALPPSPAYPDGKPARGYAVAQIESLSPVRWSRLSSRIT